MKTYLVWVSSSLYNELVTANKEPKSQFKWFLLERKEGFIFLKRVFRRNSMKYICVPKNTFLVSRADFCNQFKFIPVGYK